MIKQDHGPTLSSEQVDLSQASFPPRATLEKRGDGFDTLFTDPKGAEKIFGKPAATDLSSESLPLIEAGKLK